MLFPIFISSISGLVFKSEFKMSFFRLSKSILVILKQTKRNFLFNTLWSLKILVPKDLKNDQKAHHRLSLISTSLHVVRDQKIQEYYSY